MKKTECNSLVTRCALQGREHPCEGARHTPHVGAGPEHPTARRAPAHRTRQGSSRRWQQHGGFGLGNFIERRVADEASPEQVVRQWQIERGDERLELVEGCIGRDLHGASRTELAEEMAVTRQEYAVFPVRDLDECAVVQ